MSRSIAFLSPLTAHQRILLKISDCRERGDLTDFKVICGKTEINVHKLILCSQSPVFRAACMGNFKESVNSAYDMSEEPLHIVNRFLDFLYTGDYSEDTGELSKDLSMSVLQLHVKMFGLGDKYDIKVLCDVAVNKYSNRIKHYFQPIEYLSSIPAVFVSRATNNEDLKEAAVHLPVEKLKPVLRQNKPVRTQYDLLINKYPEFAKRLLTTLMT